jgi:hypothetical protein
MRQIRHTALALAVLLSPVSLAAQLPTVAQVFDRYAEAVGGRDAWRPVQGRTDKGSADITFAGLSGSYTRHWALPNKHRLLIDLGVVTIDSGFDGERGWEVQGGPPARMDSTEERDLAEVVQDGAYFLDPSRYAKAAVVGRELYAGADAYKVALTSKAGLESVDYFDAKTGLRIGTVRVRPTGESRVVYGDYKAFAGRMVPTRIVQDNGQGEVVLTITAVTFEALDAAVFKSPLTDGW